MIKLAALWFALLATPAMASQAGLTPEICAADEYLIGVSGRSGDWIAAIRPVCATWDPATGWPACRATARVMAVAVAVRASRSAPAVRQSAAGKSAT